MELAALDIVIGAKIDEAVANVNKFNASLDNTVAATNKLQPALDATSRNLAKSAAATAGFSGGMSKASSASNSATLALGNLGRVAQDLPFGFIGISNNLNPLLESFQRLSAESKLAGTSISSVLLKSLTGAGGLGLALSVVSAALTFASFGMSAWTRGFGDNKKAVDEAKDSLKNYLSEAANSLLSFKELTAVAADINAPLKERKKAIEDLRGEYGEYLKNLSDEQILTGQLGDAYKKVNEALLAKLTLESAEDKIKPILQQILDLQLKNADLQKVVNLGSQNQLDNAQKLSLAQRNLVIGLQNEAKSSQKAIDDNNKSIESLNLKLNNLLASLNTTIAKGKELDLTKGTDKAAKNIETIADVLAKLKLELSALDARELNEGLNLSSEKINAVEDVIKRLIVDFKVPSDSKLINELFGNIDDIKFSPENFKLFIQKLEKGLKGEVPPISIPVTVNDKSFTDDFDKRMQDLGRTLFLSDKFKIILPLGFESSSEIGGDLAKDVNKAMDAVQKVINKRNLTLPLHLTPEQAAEFAKQADAIFANMESTIKESFASVFTTIGDALGGGQNVFEAFRQVLGEGIRSIGEDLIKLGTLALIAKLALKDLFHNPLLEIAAGIALVAFSSAFESRGVTKLAGGGIIPSGFEGDRFPAMLNSGEAVIPLNKLNQFLNTESSTVVLIPEHRISGNDIVISYNRTVRKNKKTY